MPQHALYELSLLLISLLLLIVGLWIGSRMQQARRGWSELFLFLLFLLTTWFSLSDWSTPGQTHWSGYLFLLLCVVVLVRVLLIVREWLFPPRLLEVGEDDTFLSTPLTFAQAASLLREALIVRDCWLLGARSKQDGVSSYALVWLHLDKLEHRGLFELAQLQEREGAQSFAQEQVFDWKVLDIERKRCYFLLSCTYQNPSIAFTLCFPDPPSLALLDALGQSGRVFVFPGEAPGWLSSSRISFEREAIWRQLSQLQNQMESFTLYLDTKSKETVLQLVRRRASARGGRNKPGAKSPHLHAGR